MASTEQTASVTSENYTTMWQDAMPDVAWGTLLLFLGCVMGYYFTISSALDGSLPYWIATLFCAVLAYASFTVMHDAGHGSIFRMGSRLKGLEIILGWIACVPLIFTPFRFWQKIHDRHHAFTNDPDRDPDYFSPDDSRYKILFGSFTVTLRYLVKAFTSLSNVKSIRDTYPSMMVHFVCVFGSMAALTYLGYGTEVLAFAIVPIMIAVFFLAMFFDVLPHHPHTSLDRYHDTRIYPSKLLNVLLLGQNYHLIHHMFPRLPWYKYKGVYEKIIPDLEAHSAPIEDIAGGLRPGFLQSPNTTNLLNGGSSLDHVLKVAKIDRLTADACAVTLELPKAPDGRTREILKYGAGQYVTVSKWLNNEQQTRCYSLCSSPANSADRGELKIGVRHTADGLMSGFINKALEEGDELIVKGPFGEFVYPPLDSREQQQNADQDRRGELVLIAGGSGITPILAILETALQEQASTPISLIYTGRSLDSTMFLDQIDALKVTHNERLRVTYVMEKATAGDGAVEGRLSPELMTTLIPLLKSGEQCLTESTAKFYICGPEGLKNLAVETLLNQGVNSGCVHVEEFVVSMTAPVGKLHRVDVTLTDGKKHRLNVASNQTVLEVANSEGVSLPHACGNGICGSCKVSVDAGVVGDISDTMPGITAHECAAGFTLACQCKPMGDVSLSTLTH